ncbi:MAG: hypothetical protein J7521_04015 [Caulobacter sp.]|nr:hypothetical protein [Caulobacter sp.]
MKILPSIDMYEALVDAVGSTSLGEAILRCAESAGVDEVFAFWLDDDGPPVQLASSGHTGSALARASLYVDGFHRHDPLLARVRAVSGEDLADPISLSVEEIGASHYRRECFEHPGLSEKVTFVRASGVRRYVLNFYRRREHRRASVDSLLGLAQLALPVLRRHGELLGEEAGLSLTERLERRLAAAYPLLSKRERQVCARTLVGMTAEATALGLGIAETSVMTYRRRAYERYGVSSAGQFVERLLH